MPDIREMLANVKDQIHKLIKDNGALPKADEQEMQQRVDAAQAYAGESPQHFVDYGVDCIRTSVNHMRKIREVQRECLKVYYEEDPPTYTRKEKWQSKVVLPKPHAAVQFAMANVRKAFDTDFVSIENETDKVAAEMWTRIMKHYLDRSHANFPVHFTDAAGMGFAVGQSMEMIPVWRPGFGLRYIAVEPWKIHRDPDAFGREPQSGMYWVHQEYLDFHVLKEAEKAGRYQNVNAVAQYTSSGDNTTTTNPLMTQQQIMMRKDMIWARSVYRRAILTSEFWGMVLSPKGEKLLDNATYTFAGNQVIGLPKASPYRRLRWPGISFSPLPHFLRFDGRGILHGVRGLWYFLCSLAALHNDYLNWVVNPMFEVVLHDLEDQEDLTTYPGKPWLVKPTVQGQQVVRTIDRRSITPDILAYLNWGDQNFQKGSLVGDQVMGLPGYRAEVTARESAQNLDQSMGVVSLMATNIEDGAIWAVQSGAETIAANAGPQDLAEIFTQEELTQYINPDESTGMSLPVLNGSFHISGMSRVLRDLDVMKTIRDIILPLFGPNYGDIFKPYLRPYNLLKAIENRVNLRDENILVSPEKGNEIDQQQQNVQDQTVGQKESLMNQQGKTAAQNMEAQNVMMAAQAEQAKAKAGLHGAQAEAIQNPPLPAEKQGKQT